jgi:hypothetical protein
MKTRLALVIIVFTSMILLAFGCSNTNTTSKVSITSSIEKYSFFMSSVPGLPLIVTAEPAADPNQIEYVWKTTAGSFLSWGSDSGFKVVDLGADFTGSESLVYLSPPIDTEIPAEGIKVTVEVINTDTHELIGQASVFIDFSDNYFTIR